MDTLANAEIGGIAVKGDFHLDGDIMNWEIDTTAAFLWVRGDLRKAQAAKAKAKR